MAFPELKTAATCFMLCPLVRLFLCKVRTRFLVIPNLAIYPNKQEKYELPVIRIEWYISTRILQRQKIQAYCDNGKSHEVSVQPLSPDDLLVCVLVQLTLSSVPLVSKSQRIPWKGTTIFLARGLVVSTYWKTLRAVVPGPTA